MPGSPLLPAWALSWHLLQQQALTVAPRVSGNQDLSKQNGVKALKTPTLVVTDCSEASGEVLYLGLPVFSS